MRTSLLTSAAVIGTAFLFTAPTIAQDAGTPSNATVSGSADTTKRVDTPPKTEDGTKNRNAGVIETDKGRVAGDPDANDAKDKAQISDKAIENAVEEGAANASTKTKVGGTKPADAPAVTQGSAGKGTGSQTLDADQGTSASTSGAGSTPVRKGVPDGRAPSPTESRPAITGTGSPRAPH